jgi:hypothetical protein
MFKRRKTLKAAVFACLALSCLFVPAGSSAAGKGKDPGIFPLKDVHPGLKGYGLTVFSERAVEKFDVEVISVIHQFLPKQDVILVRCSHPVLDHTGVIAGMSGSPIYFNDKFAGALAYAWKFAKDPVAGITPAEDMVPYFKEASSFQKGKGGAKGVLTAKLSWFPKPGIFPAAATPGKDYWKSFTPGAPAELSPMITPLSGSLLSSDSAAALIEKEFKKFFMQPISAASSAAASLFLPKAAGAGKGKGKGKGKAAGAILKPGDAVAIQLVRGDLDLSATGTVTAVDGNKLLAFGHPMFNFGQVDIPATAAYVHHCLASMNISFKMTEPEEEVGSLVLDKQAGILIDTSRKAQVIPVHVKLRNLNTGAQEDWNVEIIHHPMMTPSVMRGAITAAMDKFSPDTDEAVLESRYKVAIRGHKPLVLEDKVFQHEGTLALDYSESLFWSLLYLMNSDFELAQIDGVEARIDVNYSNPVAVIDGAYFSAEEAEEGEVVDLFVIVDPLRGGEQIYSTSIKVPPGTEGKQLRITVEAGKNANPETITPYDLDDVIDNLSKNYPSDSIVVTVQVPAQGVSIGGKVINSLPASALDTLRPKAAYLGEQPEAVVDRKFIYPGMIMDGSVEMKLQVKGKEKP